MAEMNLRRIESHAGARVTVGPDGTMSLRPSAHAQTLTFEPKTEVLKKVLDFAKVPSGMVKQLSTDTLGRVLTDTLGDKEAYTAVMCAGQVIDLVDDSRFKALPPERVLDMVEHTIGEGLQYHRLNCLSPYHANLEIVGVDERPVTKGDLIRAGVSLTFSPIGVIQPSVQSYAIRLACTNGATSMDKLDSWQFGGGDNDSGGGVWNWMRAAMRGAYNSIDEIARSYAKMREEGVPPGERAALIEMLIKRGKLPTIVANEIRAMALEHPPENAYDAFNLMTWAASHRLINGPAVRAQAAAAAFASATEHDRICPVCHHRTGGSQN